MATTFNYEEMYSEVLGILPPDEIMMKMELNCKITHGTHAPQRKSIENDGKLIGSPADNYSTTGALGNLIKDRNVIWFCGTLFKSEIPTMCPYGNHLLVLDWKSVQQQMGNYQVFFEDYHVVERPGHKVHYACFVGVSEEDEEVLKIAQEHLPSPAKDAKVFSYDSETIQVMVNSLDTLDNRVYVELAFVADSLAIDGGYWKRVQETPRSPRK